MRRRSQRVDFSFFSFTQSRLRSSIFSACRGGLVHASSFILFIVLRKEGLTMKKQSALQAWIIMLLSLPRGIIAFVVAIAGICISIPLMIVWIGFPLLDMTLRICQWLLGEEERQVNQWLHNESNAHHPQKQQAEQGQQNQQIPYSYELADQVHTESYNEQYTGANNEPEHQATSYKWQGFSTLWSMLQDRRSYQGLFYCILQLPVGIINFTFALVFPLTFIAVMLAPIANYFSLQYFSFDLFEANTSLLTYLLPALTSFEHSLIVGGVGIVLVLLIPKMIRAFGRVYATWISVIAN